MRQWEKDLAHRIVSYGEADGAEDMAKFARVMQAVLFIAWVAFACLFTNAYVLQNSAFYWTIVASAGSLIGFFLAGGLHRRCRLLTNRYWEVREAAEHEVRLNETVIADLRKELDAAKARIRIEEPEGDAGCETRCAQVDAPVEASADDAPLGEATFTRARVG
jgi:hypothetical protein